MRHTRGGGPPGLYLTWEGRRQCKEEDPDASVPGSHLTGNTYGAIGAPQRQYHGDLGLGMEASSQEQPRLSAHSEESLGGAYPPALTCWILPLDPQTPGRKPGYEADAGRAILSRVSKGCSAALWFPPGITSSPSRR